jgi:pilus assembly protein TadC
LTRFKHLIFNGILYIKPLDKDILLYSPGAGVGFPPFPHEVSETYRRRITPITYLGDARRCFPTCERE